MSRKSLNLLQNESTVSLNTKNTHLTSNLFASLENLGRNKNKITNSNTLF